MTMLRLLLVCALVALASQPAAGALAGAEKKAFDSATEAFNLGLWDRAEAEFAAFLARHPKSEQLSEAILHQAEAQFQQKKFLAAAALLKERQADADKLADQFLYWLAEAQFRTGNYAAAAEGFGKLTRDYPASNRKLEAAVGEAAARVKLSDWTQVTNLLGRADGAFRQSASGLTNNVTVAQGYLLLAEAQLALKHYADAEAALNQAGAGFSGELDWRRRNLLCQALLGLGRTEDVLRESAGLVTAAEGTHNWDLLAESVAVRADILEKAGKPAEAIVLLRRNLAPNAPVARQEQALARITALALAQDQYDLARETLQSYLNQFTNAPAVPIALLTLGEVNLKQHTSLLAASTGAVVTNLLPVALNCFDRVITVYSNSPLVGRAQLGRGWCYWGEGRYAESASAFEAAVKLLPASEDLVVARFKLADSLFQLADYGAALEQYRVAMQIATNSPGANARLRSPALSQALRASLVLTNLANAEEIVRDILKTDLAARGLAITNEPAPAPAWLEQFTVMFPGSEWRPQVELLIARAHEQQSAWTNVIAAYDGWLTRFPTNALRPQVEFQLALALAHSGQETNAWNHFTNFLAQFRTNDLAPRAQWWVADYAFNRGEFAEAEIAFKQLFQNWKTSALADEARLMAGRAAMQWSGYPNAIEYFTGLINDTNCAPDLWSRAVLACGSALMRQAPAETNRLAGYASAVQMFELIPQRFPTNASAAAAWGEIGNCHLQLATADPRNYDAASNAYQKVITLPGADVATRSQALCGLGLIAEKLAETLNGDQRPALLLRARDLYLDVALEKNLRDGETADGYWVKEAGFRALRLLETMQGWPTQDAEAVIRFCRRMQQVLPQLAARFETVILRARSPAPPQKS